MTASDWGWHVLSDGPLLSALLASTAIPGIFPPTEIGPGLYGSP